MLYIKAQGSREAWVRSLLGLMKTGSQTDNEKYFRDEPTVIDISSPSLEPAHPLFPMSQYDLDVINHYIHSGEQEEEVVHEWTKLYHHRIFDEPYSQMRYLLKLLKSDEPEGPCQISLWDKSVDQEVEVSPCTLVLWARRRADAVEFHVHAHSSDAYNKLLMNLQEFISLHHFVARSANLKVGRYLHFIDSCHLHATDLDEVEAVCRQLEAS